MTPKFKTKPPGTLARTALLPDIPSISAEFGACTIIAKNYLPMARVLAESFQKHNPGCPFFVLFVDPAEGYFEPAKESFHAVETRQLGIPNVEGLVFKYNVLEASTAVKPYLLAYLFRKHSIKKLIYLDPDILILKPLNELAVLLEQHSIVLTPHITTPFPDQAKPGDYDILLAGSFNLGFLGVRNSETTGRFLSWWQRKVYHHCLIAFDKGLFVDQRWVDMVPALFDDCHILRSPGYNVAYWNLHERKLTVQDDEITVNGGPGYFFHFSGFNPADGSTVSKHQTRFKMQNLGAAQKLFDLYSAKVRAKGWKECRAWPYTYNYFHDGTEIPYSARRFYWSLGTEVEHLGNPFDWMTTGTDLEASVSSLKGAQRRPDSERKRPFGLNVVGYLTSEKGVGEAVRSNLRIMRAAGVPFAANNFEDSGSQNLERLPDNFSHENPYAINLININADQMPHFAERNSEYLRGRYNIGYWAWELAAFPPEWSGSFGYLNEVWVPSNFVRDSVLKISPLPVNVLPHSIDPTLKDGAEATRERLRIPPETFLFLFLFDFHSFIERKNPSSLIRSFRKAFGDRKDVMLLIKSSHASSDPAGLKALQSEAGAANVKIIDMIMSRATVHSLIASCNCYTSLHRSEGFGLTLLEAMQCAKPVIATGYSGNMDFMNRDNSFLVDYRLTAIEKDHGPYKAGSEWADPDTAHAAELMRYVVEKPAVAAGIAERGQKHVQQTLNPNALAKIVHRRFGELGCEVAAEPSSLVNNA